MLQKNNPSDLQILIPKELKDIYQCDQIEDIESDIKELGMLNPISLAKDGIPLDGYRRLNVAIKLGMDYVPVLQTELEATPENRAALNQHREKTWLDLRNEYLITFDTFGKRQGKKQELAIKKFDRYVEIRKRMKNRFKDTATIKDVEWILNNDNGDFPMSWWLLEKKCEVKSIKALMELSLKEDHTEIYKLVRDRDMSPKDALKEIKYLAKNLDAKKREFKLPQAEGVIAEIHLGEPAELLVQMDKESIKALFYTPEKYVSFMNDEESNYPRVKRQEPSVYGQKAVDPIRPWIDRMTKSSSLLVFAQEYYDNGFALQIPSNLIKSIAEETGLYFKQILFVADGQLLTDNNSGKNLSDVVTQILWFVKDRVEATAAFSQPSFLTPIEVNGEVGDTYKNCTNFLSVQEIADIVIKKGGEFSAKDDPNYAALIPLLIATKEKDLVVDISMKSDIGTIAVMMNRRFIGISPLESSFDTSAKALIKAVKEFSAEAEEKKPKSRSKKKEQQNKVAA